MPIHDWTRVTAGTFHSFHSSWIAAILEVLNNGILPDNYYALSEQIAGNLGPDVLALEVTEPADEPPANGSSGGIAVALAPPKVRFRATLEMDSYALKARTLVIRHTSDDRIVALVEIVSPGNKGSRNALRAFVEKAAGALTCGYQLLLVDLHPPSRRDPQGIHGAILEEIGDDTYVAPPDKPLTLAAYSAGVVKIAYVEPIAVGDTMPDMPLFLDPETYVPVPLEATYLRAYHAVPRRLRAVLDALNPSSGS